MYKRTLNKTLSFTGEKLTRERHRIHPYPAMLHPLLVDFLIEKYAKKDDIIFDPFCGSGVVLVQAGINNHKSIGFDINPLSLLIAKIKTQKYNIKRLLKEFEQFKKDISNNKKIDIPAIKNIDYWYSKEVIEDLGKIRNVLKNKKYQYKDFFIISFAFICRNQSFTRNGEFKRYRIKKEKIDLLENKVFDKFYSHIETMIEIIKNSPEPKKESKIMLLNSENKIPSNLTYNLVITSPPYGDSRTTVAYGEYSSFGLEWTRDLNYLGDITYKVDSECIGKAGELNEELQNHKILINIIKKIEKSDKKRARDVLYFYNGYYNVIKNIIVNLKKGGRICFVVGNRTVKNNQIPMDQITASFFDSLGLKFENIFVRDILNKVMPSKNSPTNKVGVKTKTMMNEYIVIFKK